MNGVCIKIANIIRSTAWTAPQIKPFSLFHLALFIFGITASALLAFRCKHFNNKQCSVILIVVGLFLLIAEGYKQLFYTVLRDNGIYDLSLLPFQLCSMPLYFCFLLPFIHSGRFRDALCCFIATYNLLGGLLALAFPAEIFARYITVTVQSLLWHYALIFLAVFQLAQRKTAFSLRNFVDCAGIFCVISAAAILINRICTPYSLRPMRLFFIGRQDPDIPVFHRLYSHFGWITSTVIFILSATAGSFIIWLCERRVILRMSEKAAK